MTKKIPKTSVSIAKGLDAMFSANISNSDLVAKTDRKQDHLTRSITAIQPGKYQPRTQFDDDGIAELSESIKSQGIIQPIIVREIKKDLFEIIAGERRWRAAQLAGLKEIPVIIKELTDNEALLFGIIENLQREDLNPIDTALALQKMYDEFNMTHADIAKQVGKSRSAVSNSLRLLDLSEPAKDELVTGDIEVGHAKILLGFKKEEQQELLQHIIVGKLSVRQTEEFAKKIKYNKSLSKPTNISNIPDEKIAYWSDKFSKKLDTNVKIRFNNQGRGVISINIDSLQQLEDFFDSF